MQIANEWQKYKGYTVRPLDSTTSYYQKIIRDNIQKENFLIYGGTPEIRSIFQNYSLYVTLLDRSEEIIRAMGYLTLERVPIASNESFIKENWLCIEETKRKYDLILGDDAINMVRWCDFDLFLYNAHRLLVEDGLFVCHLLVKPYDHFIDQDFFDIVNQYHRKTILSQFDLASRLNFICYDKNSYAMGWQRTITMLGKKRLAVLNTQFDFVDTFKFCNSQFYCPPQMQFEQLVQRYFKIVEIFYPHEHEYCLFEPVYCLQRK